MPDYNSDTDTDIELQPVAMDGDIHKVIPWTEAHENILVDWADKALCYRWLHTKAHQHYTHANMWFTIPVIIMSTLTGTANFAQDKFPDSIRNYATMGIGAVNIFAGILTTISQFLKVGELNEAHRVSSISWDKFYRNIKVELAKAPDERQPVLQTLKIAKEEFDRLMETSPAIDENITDLFQRTFTDGKGGDIPLDQQTRKQKLFTALKKPEICDELVSCKQFVYRISDKEKARGSLQGKIDLAKKTMKLKMQTDTINRVINLFLDSRKRMPTDEEILNELSDDNIDKKTIEKVLNNRNKPASQSYYDNIIITPSDENV